MPLGSFEPLPFRHGCAATLSPFHGDSFWLVLPPACPERGGGFCEAKAGGVIKQLIALCLSQPLSHGLRRASSSCGEPFWCGANSNQKLSPQAGKVDTNGVSGRKGNGSEPPSFFTIPPQLRLRSAAPPQAVAPFYAAQARRAVPYPFAKRSFQYPHSPILYTCSRQRSLFAITPSASLESSCAR